MSDSTNRGRGMYGIPSTGHKNTIKHHQYIKKKALDMTNIQDVRKYFKRYYYLCHD